jgi:hypothetical protein
VKSIVRVFRGARSVDRRTEPSHGYRAVHVIVKLQGRLVELQVRTRLQDSWAQAMERLADRLGRDIRYGAQAKDPRVVRLLRTSNALRIIENSYERRRGLLAHPERAPSRQRALRVLQARLKREIAEEREQFRAMLDEIVAEKDEKDD